MRPYRQSSDLPTLIALIVAVGFPLLLLALVFDFFPRDQITGLLASTQLPFWQTTARIEPSPAAVASPTTVPLLASDDWGIPDGHFFTQRNGKPPRTSTLGFAVTNTPGAAIWDEVSRLGGVDVVGYPLSNRFPWRGFSVQVFEKMVFMASEQQPELAVMNVYDELHNMGKDDWLEAERFTPRPLPADFDQDRAPADIPAARLALLSEDPAIEAAFKAAKDPVRQYGLPTSKVTDMGPYLVAVRCQRAVLQRWKLDMPWAKAGQVTIANGGQIAIEAGLFPADAIKPVDMPPAGSVAAPRPSPVTTSR